MLPEERTSKIKIARLERCLSSFLKNENINYKNSLGVMVDIDTNYALYFSFTTNGKEFEKDGCISSKEINSAFRNKVADFISMNEELDGKICYESFYIRFEQGKIKYTEFYE